ncbi:MAG TPA: HAD-IB family hydrolase [Acidimicrobiia bacterium]|nr:HAD-IB family hydrolase [Acidimicrobiia bacterium]
MTTSAPAPRDAAAFFDLDRTLIAGASTFIFGWVAWRKGFLTTRELAGDAASAFTFRLTGGSDDQPERVRDRILEAVQGHRREELTALNDDILPRLLASVRPETRQVVERHHETGRDTYIVSASPIEIVGPLGAALGMTGVIATESEVVDGVYTGRLLSEFCYGPGKVSRVVQLAEEKGYDLRLCYAYSDSRSDLPLLELVGHPVAVNPDSTLRRVARSRNWPVVQFARRAKITATAVGSGMAVAGMGAGLYALGRVHGRRALS